MDENAMDDEVYPYGDDGLYVPLPYTGIVRVELFSFGWLHEEGIPGEVTDMQPEFVIDLRRLFRDPHHDPAFRELTGRDDAVRARVLNQPGAREYADAQAATIASLVPAASALPQPRKIFAAFFCAGGRHRSVVMADEVAFRLNMQGIGTGVAHMHIRRPVVDR